MNTNLRKWIPIALCCLPGVAVAVVVGVGIAAGGAALGAWLRGPWGLAILALAILACPLSMGLMMRQRESGQALPPSSSMMDCCLPGEDPSTVELATLRSKREALEREVAEMQNSEAR